MNRFFKKCTRNISNAFHTVKCYVNRGYAARKTAAFTLAEVFSPHYYSPRKAAFTLAEVLITLGIIGVVAALTLPTLMANHRKIEYASRIKKFYSSMQQAILMAQNDYGDTKYWTTAPNSIIKDEDGNPILDENGNAQYDPDAGPKATMAFLNTYILPYIKYTKVIEKDPDFSYTTTIYFSDGGTAQVWNGSCIDFKYDVNGLNNPNREGRDQFRFLICITPEARKIYFGNQNQSFGSFLKVNNGRNDRNQALNRCKGTQTSACTRLLEIDGWEFKDDYPWKL